MGMNVKVKYVDMDYSKWLGPNYTTNEKFSTYVCNHVGYPDVPTLLYAFKGNISFCAADYLVHWPFIGPMIK